MLELTYLLTQSREVLGATGQHLGMDETTRAKILELEICLIDDGKWNEGVVLGYMEIPRGKKRASRCYAISCMWYGRPRRDGEMG